METRLPLLSSWGGSCGTVGSGFRISRASPVLMVGRSTDVVCIGASLGPFLGFRTYMEGSTISGSVGVTMRDLWSFGIEAS
jgi:hypothetical protein